MPQTLTPLTVSGFQIQETPKIYMAAISGKWLLRHATPSWRIRDPIQGFQRIVREERAREIALTVLDQHRTFPNSIVLATDVDSIVDNGGSLLIPLEIKFLVVDGQHRLWAQNYSDYEALYPCVIHTKLTEIQMARLFLEINDNQKRVPPSLRWDLVRLVRPEDDPESIAASDMVFQLTNDEQSPMYQRIDLTGEQPEIALKQGSIAPSIRLLFTRRSPIHDLSFNQQYAIVLQYLLAIKELDRDGWRSGKSAFYATRVLRALLRLLSDIIRQVGGDHTALTFQSFTPYLVKIDVNSISTENLRATQGEAGILAIYKQIRAQALA